MAYSKDPETRFFLGSIEVDATLGTARVDGALLPLGKKVVATLAALFARAGEVVPKQSLLASTWGEAAIDDSSLWQNVHVLRSVLARHAPAATIETVKGRGYCLKLAPPAATPAKPAAAIAKPGAAPAKPANSSLRRYWPVAAALVLGIALGGMTRHPARAPRTLILVTTTDEKSLPPLPPLPALAGP